MEMFRKKLMRLLKRPPRSPLPDVSLDDRKWILIEIAIGRITSYTSSPFAGVFSSSFDFVTFSVIVIRRLCVKSDV